MVRFINTRKFLMTKADGEWLVDYLYGSGIWQSEVRDADTWLVTEWERDGERTLEVFIAIDGEPISGEGFVMDHYETFERVCDVVSTRFPREDFVDE